MPPHVTQHPTVTTDNAGKPLTISVAVPITGGAATASVVIMDNTTGTPVAVASSKAVSGSNDVTLSVTIPQVKLWSVGAPRGSLHGGGRRFFFITDVFANSI